MSKQVLSLPACTKVQTPARSMHERTNTDTHFDWTIKAGEAVAASVGAAVQDNVLHASTGRSRPQPQQKSQKEQTEDGA